MLYSLILQSPLAQRIAGILNLSACVHGPIAGADRRELLVAAKRELFKSSDVCELTRLQPYVLRSWEAEFPGLGKPAANGSGRLYQRSDVDMVLRIRDLVFGEGLTLAGARRRLEEEQEKPGTSVAAVAVNDVLDDFARRKLREVRSGLEAILALVSRSSDGSPVPELKLVSPAARGKSNTAKRRRAS